MSREQYDNLSDNLILYVNDPIKRGNSKVLFLMLQYYFKMRLYIHQYIAPISTFASH